MKNNILIHKNTNYKKLLFKYVIALIPLIIYGIYKNSVLLYLNKSGSILGLFKPLLFPILGALCGLIVNSIRKKKVYFNPLILYGLLIGIMMPINCNLIIFSISVFLLLLGITYIEDKVRINYICLVKLLIILLLILFKQYNYANAIESASTYAFSFVDILFGRQIGGICSSSFFWIIVGFIYLCTDYYYKKDIPLITYTTYTIVIVLSYIFTKNLSSVMNNLVAAAPVFTFVFIAPITEFSPYTKKGKIIYSFLIGVLSAILVIIIGSMEAALIAVLLISLIKKWLDTNLIQKNTN